MQVAVNPGEGLRFYEGDMRKLHIGDQVYGYKIGRSGIKIRYPDGGRRYIKHEEFMGVTPDTLERALHKDYWPQIGPGDVKAFLEGKPFARGYIL